MFPTSSYKRLYNDIIDRYDTYSDDEYVTFGILIADARQGEAREYILNYLNVFNKSSGKYFDFFIPGYNNDKWSGGREIRLEDNKYYFCENLFVEFCENLHTDFGIKYTFNPMLILMTMKKGYKGTAKYIVIELDDYGDYGVRRSGQLFLDIFEATKKSSNLNDIKDSLTGTYIKGNVLDSIINAIGQEWLCEIRRSSNELKRYKIKKLR